MQWTVYIYLAVMFILGCVGAKYQFTHGGDPNDDDYNKEDGKAGSDDGKDD